MDTLIFSSTATRTLLEGNAIFYTLNLFHLLTFIFANTFCNYTYNNNPTRIRQDVTNSFASSLKRRLVNRWDRVKNCETPSEKASATKALTEFGVQYGHILQHFSGRYGNRGADQLQQTHVLLHVGTVIDVQALYGRDPATGTSITRINTILHILFHLLC